MTMRASELMSTGLLTFPPEASVDVMAHALSERGVSGAPVVDGEGRLLGMVTEGDLIRRLAAAADTPRGWFSGLFTSAAADAACFARAEGRRARDVMTTDLATVNEDASAEAIAHIMEERHVKRVPVVRGGLLVGLVSRADLLRALVARDSLASESASDASIRRGLAAAMRGKSWIDSYFIFSEVKDGVVKLHGFCGSEEVIRALRVLAEGIPGVRQVELEFSPPPPFLIGAP